MMQNQDKRKRTARKEEKCPLSARLGALLDVPADLICGGCYLEMRGQGELSLQGCRRIAVYTPEEIVLRLRNGSVRLGGKRLTCLSYHAGKITVRGWITEIAFRGTEEGM